MHVQVDLDQPTWLSGGGCGTYGATTDDKLQKVVTDLQITDASNLVKRIKVRNGKDHMLQSLKVDDIVRISRLSR